MTEFSHYSYGGKTLAYLLTRPEKADKTQPLPMIVFLHGAGERGDDLKTLARHGIPKYFGADAEYLGTQVVTLSPQCEGNISWSQLTEIVMQLILEVAKKENVDFSRISITGLSMGGFGTWEMLCCYPDFFSAAAPVCGGGMSWRINTQTPVRAFHGDIDPTVPAAYSYMMVDALNARGGHAELTIFHDCKHDSWTRTYEHTDVIPWLIAQKRA